MTTVSVCTVARGIVGDITTHSKYRSHAEPASTILQSDDTGPLGSTPIIAASSEELTGFSRLRADDHGIVRISVPLPASKALLTT